MLETQVLKMAVKMSRKLFMVYAMCAVSILSNVLRVYSMFIFSQCSAKEI